MFEAKALFGSPSKPGEIIPNPSRPLVILPIDVALSNVVDLTDPVASATIDTNAQELTGDLPPINWEMRRMHWLGYKV